VTDCIFCRIVQGVEPANVVVRWSDAIAIVPRNPVTRGHVLVIPKQHVQDYLDDPAVSAMVTARAAEIAPHPSNLITSAGALASQTVYHLHAHVVPRREGDGLPLPWTPQHAGRSPS
jgi:histidine triad (HIT) family protein